MTRRQLKQAALGRAMGVVGTPIQANPIERNRLLTAKCSELENILDALYVTARFDIVSGQADYCASSLYKILRVDAVLSNGKVRQLALYTAEGAYGPRWRTDPESGDPAYYITLGASDVSLYPVPNYNATNGGIVRGYGTSANLWNGEDDPCPLPQRMEECLIWGHAEDILRNFARDDRAAGIAHANYFRLKGHLESDAMTLTEQHRQHQDAQIASMGWNELDLTTGPLNQF